MRKGVSLTSLWGIPYTYVRNNDLGKETILATATVTSKGQITIPAEVRAALRLDAGDRVEFVEIEEGKFAVIPVTRSIRELEGRFQDKRRKPVSIDEMNAAIRRRAAKSR